MQLAIEKHLPPAQVPAGGASVPGFDGAAGFGSVPGFGVSAAVRGEALAESVLCTV